MQGSARAARPRSRPCRQRKEPRIPGLFQVQMVRVKGLEPSWGCPHTDLNRTRLPIPPHPHLLSDLGRKQEQMIQDFIRLCKTEICSCGEKRPITSKRRKLSRVSRAALPEYAPRRLLTGRCRASARRGRSDRRPRAPAARPCARCRRRSRSGCRQSRPRGGRAG